MARFGWLGLSVLLAFSVASADAGARTEQGLLAADAARTEAMVAGDTAALDRALGTALTYGHSNGQVQGKAELLEELRSGARRYRTLATEDREARIYDCAGVVTGEAAAAVEYRGHAASFRMRYTATYTWDHDRWVLVAYQSVTLPDGPRPTNAPSR